MKIEIRIFLLFFAVMGTPIQQYFYKKSIFLTGATGFMGKTLMEKLLRTCDVEVFYILVRTKKGKGTTSRLEEIFNDPVSLLHFYSSFESINVNFS